ncbi:MAG: NADH dehydrogenase [Enterobacterales bacterium]
MSTGAHQQALFPAKNIESYLIQQPLESFTYKDKGSLISLSQDDSIGTLMGRLMGRLMGNITRHGFIAKMLDRAHYRSHQLSIDGFYKTIVLMLSDFLGRSTGDKTKLH